MTAKRQFRFSLDAFRIILVLVVVVVTLIAIWRSERMAGIRDQRQRQEMREILDRAMKQQEQGEQ